MLKAIARKILKKELSDLHDKIETISAERDKVQEENYELINKTVNMQKEAANAKLSAETKAKQAEQKAYDLEYQNDLLRRYYQIDQEPSEEIKTRMRLDVKYHEMELEITRLKAQAKSNWSFVPWTIYVPQYSSLYSGCYHPMLY